MKSQSVTIQMKAIEQYFPVVLFIMLYKVILTLESVCEIQKCNHSNESYCVVVPVVLFIMLYKVVLTFESVDEILKRDHSNESYCGAVYRIFSIKRWAPIKHRLRFNTWSKPLLFK